MGTDAENNYINEIYTEIVISGDNFYPALNRRSTMHKVSNLLVFIGLVSFAIALAVNLYGSYAVSHVNSAPLFSTNWWARWFPIYASGIALLFIGLVLRLTGRAR